MIGVPGTVAQVFIGFAIGLFMAYLISALRQTRMRRVLRSLRVGVSLDTSFMWVGIQWDFAWKEIIVCIIPFVPIDFNWRG